MKFIGKKRFLFSIFFIVVLLFFGPSRAGEHGQAEEWKEPEVPKTEAERTALEQDIEKRQRQIDQERPDDPKVQLKNQQLKAEIAVLELGKAEDQLQINPNDAAAQLRKVEAQKLLQEALKEVEAINQGTFVPSEGMKKRTVLEQFAFDFNQKLTKTLQDIKESYPNDIALKQAQFRTISDEYNRMRLGRESVLLTDVDYSVIDFARQKEILQMLDRALVDSGYQSPGTKTLLENIENRIKEIAAFKPGPDFPNNKLVQELNLANKLPSDRLQMLKDRFNSATFNDVYKDATAQQQVFRDLKQVLLLYQISFKEFFALNSTVTPTFINSIALGVSTDGERIGIYTWVLNEALAESSYTIQERRLKYLDAALQDPRLSEYKGLADYIKTARDQIKTRIAQIEAVKNKTVPVPTPGSLAEALQLNKKIPADQIVAVENQFVTIQSQVIDIFKEQRQFAKGDNLYAWEKPELEQLQKAVSSMRTLLEDASKLYNLDTEYQSRFIAMNDPITSLQRQVEEVLESHISIAQTVYADISSLVPDLFIGKTGLEIESPSKSMAEMVGQTLDLLNDVVVTVIQQQGELMKIVSGGAKVVGDYLVQAPELLEGTQKFLSDLEQNTNAHILGKANLWIIEQAGTIEDRQVVANLIVDAFGKVKDFVNSDAVKQVAQGAKAVGETFNGVAAVVEEIGNKLEQAGQEAKTPDESNERKLEAIKTAQALIDKEKVALSSVSEVDVETYNKFFKEFIQKILSWLRTAFNTPKTGLNDRYVAAMTNYTTQRDLYLRYLGVTAESTSDEIHNAMEIKFTEDKQGSIKAMNDVFGSAREMMAVLKEAQKAFQAVQANIRFSIESWDSLTPAATNQRASAAQTIIELFEARNKKLAYLESAQRSMALLKSNLRAMVPKNIKNLAVQSDDFITISIAANKLYIAEEQIKTIQNYQNLIKGLDDELNKKQQEIVNSLGNSSANSGGGGITFGE